MKKRNKTSDLLREASLVFITYFMMSMGSEMGHAAVEAIMAHLF